MKTIQDFNFCNKKALIRVDFNVPQNNELKVTDTTRILAAKPSIDKIISDGGSVILMTHLGRPKGQKDNQFSLKTIISSVSEILGKEVIFVEDCVGEMVEKKCSELKNGQILLLENLRFYKEEEEGNAEFAQELAQLGDIYVNDAFGTSHRSHASTSIIANYFAENKCFGLLMAKELEAIDKILTSGKKPITAILGGSKVSSKITIIENILSKIDHLIIGGGMAFTFIKALGGTIGSSLVEDDKLALALDILEKAKQNNVTMHLPVDIVCADAFSNDAIIEVHDAYQIPENWLGLDAGPKTALLVNDVIMKSQTILWNGPLGVFEMPNFAKGSISLGDSIGEATRLGAFSLVGGGDSVAFVKQFNYDTKVSYVSTGGGAMLESLEGKILPGVSAMI